MNYQAPEPKRKGRVTVAQLQIEIDSLKNRCAEMQRSGLDERAQGMLRQLNHFYSRVVNAQCHCKEDRAMLDRFVDELQCVPGIERKHSNDESGQSGHPT